MKRASQREFNFYTELCPAASVATIGVGIITITLGGVFTAGLAIMLTGVALGIITPNTRHRVQVERAARHHYHHRHIERRH